MQIFCCLYEYKVSKVNRIHKVIVETCFQRFYWGNRVRDSEYDIVNNIWYIFVVVYRLKVNKVQILSEMWFQRFYWGNRIGWFRICYCQQHIWNICCCLRLKSKQVSEFSQKRGFSGSTGVIGCILMSLMPISRDIYFCCNVSSLNLNYQWWLSPIPRAEGPSINIE